MAGTIRSTEKRRSFSDHPHSREKQLNPINGDGRFPILPVLKRSGLEAQKKLDFYFLGGTAEEENNPREGSECLRVSMESVAGEEQAEKAEEVGGGGGGGGKEERILVSVRVRPLNAKEIERNDTADWECINDTTIVLKSSNLPDRSVYPTMFTFDRVFGFECSTRDVYEQGAKEVALSVVTGINATIFAYGQTSSGKTYTMTGITEHSVADIYDYIKRHKEREFVVKFSAMEIYNEAVRDLLSVEASSLRLLDDPERGTIVEKLTEETLRDETHLKELLSICEAQRQIGETVLNETSSRSHQILRLTIESSTGEFVSRNSSVAATVNFVDLAGSERASQASSAGARLKEGCHINRSLLTLGTVIRKLSEGRNGHIPYRDSKLTRILQSSLGGNARTAIVCTMNAARSHVEQSRNTLLFANCAKQVVTNAQVNVVMSDKALIKHLQREVTRLESELSNPGLTSRTTHFEALRDKDSQIKKMERDIIELMQQRDLAQSRLDDLLRAVGDNEQASRLWDELSQSSIVSQMQNTQEDVCSISGTSGAAYRSPDFYSTRFSSSSGIAYQSPDTESRRFYDTSGTAYQSPEIESTRLCTSHESNYEDENHLELHSKLDKDHDISPRHSVSSSATSGMILQWRRGKGFKSTQEKIEDHCKEVRCIDMHALSTSKSEESSAASMIQDDDSLPSQGEVTDTTKLENPGSHHGVGIDLITRMEQPMDTTTSAVGVIIKPCAGTSSLLPKMDKLMASGESAQTRSGNSNGMLMIASSFSSEDAEQHHETQLDAISDGVLTNTSESGHHAKNVARSHEESHRTIELSGDVVGTGDILIVHEDNATNISNCSPRVVQSQHHRELRDDQENQDSQVEDSEVEKTMMDVGIDSVLYPVESPSRWSFDFERKQQEIIEIWHACNVPMVHRTYFFLLFNGDPTDPIYIEVEHRRLSFLQNTSSHVHCATAIAPESSRNPTSSSLRCLRREREMLYKHMQKKLTLQERISLYTDWGINLDSKQRRWQLTQRIWTQTDMAHVKGSASLVAKLIGLAGQGQVLREMFGLSFLPQQTNHKYFIWKNKKSTSMA
ncbi:kinesin-like protein KIN-7F isoform X2 [Zingiber officinale]|uniref:kinesin-like protein KIN-7F isoform X2 n=1 Tax=Zingiber officinale TaxID=94328 RepID=UPI001C4DD730|nr:kinesin-like protein KIN-7F isoform X2 [Zingiber officinale]